MVTNEIAIHLCESDSDCDHRIPKDAFDSLDHWRSEDNRDRDDDLYIVRSECANTFPVLQRYGNYCVVKATGRS